MHKKRRVLIRKTTADRTPNSDGLRTASDAVGTTIVVRRNARLGVDDGKVMFESA